MNEAPNYMELGMNGSRGGDKGLSVTVGCGGFRVAVYHPWVAAAMDNSRGSRKLLVRLLRDDGSGQYAWHNLPEPLREWALRLRDTVEPFIAELESLTSAACEEKRDNEFAVDLERITARYPDVVERLARRRPLDEAVRDIAKGKRGKRRKR